MFRAGFVKERQNGVPQYVRLETSWFAFGIVTFFARPQLPSRMARARLAVPKDITVAAIQDVFEDYLKGSNTRDLTSLLADLQRHTSWKSAPRAETLAQYAGLYQLLMKLSPTGILPPKFTMMALVALHKVKPVNFTSKPLDIWADELSMTIRAGLQKYRDVAKDCEAHRRSFAKASGFLVRMLVFLVVCYGRACVNDKCGCFEVSLFAPSKGCRLNSGYRFRVTFPCVFEQKMATLPDVEASQVERSAVQQVLDLFENDGQGSRAITPPLVPDPGRLALDIAVAEPKGTTQLSWASLGDFFVDFTKRFDVDGAAILSARSHDSDKSMRSTTSTVLYPVSPNEIEEELIKLAMRTPPVPPSSRGQGSVVKAAKAAKAKSKAAKAKSEKTAAKAKPPKSKICTQAEADAKTPKSKGSKVAGLDTTPAKEATTLQTTQTPTSKARAKATSTGKKGQALKMDMKNVRSRAYHTAVREAMAAGSTECEAKQCGRNAAHAAAQHFSKIVD